MSHPIENAGFEKLKAGWLEAEGVQRREAALRKSALLERGRSVFEKFGVTQVVLFGSVASGRSSLKSDIDLLVWPLAAEIFWTLKYELEEATGYPCDIHTEADDPIFINKVRTRGEVIYGRET